MSDLVNKVEAEVKAVEAKVVEEVKAVETEAEAAWAWLMKNAAAVKAKLEMML
jgi:hypothetical protein